MRNSFVFESCYLKSEGLQNLYSGVRFPPAPPIHQSNLFNNLQVEFLPVSPRVRADYPSDKTGEYRTKRPVHPGQGSRTRSRTNQRYTKEKTVNDQQ
jgi:hypothetical protein